MSEADAADIINAAPRIKVKGVERQQRDPHRTITVVLIGIPPCAAYPEGKELWVHPRQVQAHLKLYPGSYVIKERSRTMTHRKAHGSGSNPKGHVTSHKDFAPGAVRHDFGKR